jgi:hypothetical protein
MLLIDGGNMEYIHLAPSEGTAGVDRHVSILRGDNCSACLGIFYDDYPGESIFCKHPCHLKRNHA